MVSVLCLAGRRRVVNKPTPDDCPRVTVVDDGAFGMPDMFKQDLGRDRGPSFGKNQEAATTKTYMLHLELYAADRSTFVGPYREVFVRDGFLVGTRLDEAIECWNKDDVKSYRVEVS